MEGLVLAGTSSGVGKTVATLATLTALEDAGYQPQPAKAGPDFIDPSHHEALVDTPSRTLDPWLAGEDGMSRTYWRGEGDICVVEGVMGLYDGSKTSTAAVAEGLDLPVVLVVDAKAGMESVAATALGFAQYADRVGVDIDVAGILAQRAHGGRHADGIKNALPEDLTYFGRIPPMSELEIPDRHLGLQMGAEAGLDRDALSTAAETIDVERLVDVARAPPEVAPAKTDSGSAATDRRVAVAQDSAFCFIYPSVLERLQSEATVEAFSPVAGDPVPDADAIYLPGGYPELHGEALETGGTLDEIADRAADGVPVYGECGGLMALAESLTTTDGDTYEMAGVLPADIEMQDRYQALDHVELEAQSDTVAAASGEHRRGHEFHYSAADVAGDASFAFDMVRGDGIDGEHDGLTEYNTVGTYCHCHGESGAFDRLLEVPSKDI
ncbi:cobyrinic acid a,c-diamide synthase [Haloarcula sp. CBA1130]|uniref:cobyrinic acid a,c-diamide synthase n=1 Tax=unclassified Haloarcula TaxID=2624677 RepID=UPI0012485A84|nr:MULTISPECIES: cobyrinic acid a,c-diamide synthase [unclassified Haloarcula]KAA9397893.1 cobyrinic acid a,c-diamide synthase [Haloarcula sp. CBA1129]KAA9402418.1 cobyrinic acid a,c-diamide synthase [Haloarcula sp. CBA1130]